MTWNEGVFSEEGFFPGDYGGGRSPTPFNAGADNTTTYVHTSRAQNVYGGDSYGAASTGYPKSVPKGSAAYNAILVDKGIAISKRLVNPQASVQVWFDTKNRQYSYRFTKSTAAIEILQAPSSGALPPAATYDVPVPPETKGGLKVLDAAQKKLQELLNKGGPSTFTGPSAGDTAYDPGPTESEGLPTWMYVVGGLVVVGGIGAAVYFGRRK